MSAWSVRRLAFEPKDWQIRFRHRLREALAGLQATPGSVLQATYAAPDDAFVDVENVLVYNVGTGCFRHVTGDGITLRRTRSADHRHGLRYEMVPATALRAGGPSAVRFAAEVADVRDLAAVWRAVRQATPVPPDTRIEGRFRLALTLTDRSAQPATALSTVMKPLLDGVLSAFSVHTGEDTPAVAERLALRLGVRPGQIAAELARPGWGVLGGREVVRPYRHHVQWNPADDRCDEADLRVVRRTTPGAPRWRIAGLIDALGS
ncbi:MAG: hypothetical protein QM597_09535 [Aeromicrobium sp.]|uniref:hypothetical protein n=1 Tax=Aeromicrobium sp. TaxID=1871063 RepID=UPI0039E550C8